MIEFLQNKMDALGYHADLCQIDNGNIHYVYSIKGKDLILKVRSNHASKYPDVGINAQDIQKEIDILKITNDISIDNIKIPQLVEYEVNDENLPSWMIIESLGNPYDFYNCDINRGLSNDDFFRLGKNFSNLHSAIQRSELFDMLNDANGKDYFERYFEHKVGKVTEHQDLFSELKLNTSYLVHGDLIPKNLIFRENNLSVIDWEYTHFGSLELELALFLSEMEKGTKKKIPKDAQKALITGYSSTDGQNIKINERLLYKVNDAFSLKVR